MEDKKNYVKERIEKYGNIDKFSQALIEDEEEFRAFLENTEILDDPFIANMLTIIFMVTHLPVNNIPMPIFVKEEDCYFYKEPDTDIKQ